MLCHMFYLIAPYPEVIQDNNTYSIWPEKLDEASLPQGKLVVLCEEDSMAALPLKEQKKLIPSRRCFWT